MKRFFLIAAALTVGLAGSTAATAESFEPGAEDTGMSWRAANHESYTQYRTGYAGPGARVPSSAYAAPGDVYGGTPVQHYGYGPAYGHASPVYAPGYVVTYPAYPAY